MCSRKWSASLLPVSPYVDLCASYAIDGIYGNARKVVNYFSGSIRSLYLNHVRNKGTVRRVRVHLNAPGWFLDLTNLDLT